MEVIIADVFILKNFGLFLIIIHRFPSFIKTDSLFRLQKIEQVISFVNAGGETNQKQRDKA